MFASPYLRYVTLELCLLLAFSIAAQPRIRFLRLALNRYSASDRLLLSCAMPNLSMTSWAMCSLSLASKIRFLLQSLKALAVVKKVVA